MFSRALHVKPIGWLLCAHAVRRLGGISGDVFGALIEIVTALTLLGLAVASS